VSSLSLKLNHCVFVFFICMVVHCYAVAESSVYTFLLIFALLNPFYMQHEGTGVCVLLWCCGVSSMESFLLVIVKQANFVHGFT
jgi:hypothetical protein